MAKHGNKETLMITLNPDVKEMIQKQAAEKHLSVSNYVERFVLKNDYESKHGPKDTLMISLNPDVNEMIQKQAAENNLSVSNYVERFVLEKDYESKLTDNEDRPTDNE